jgi:uncharacterized protein
VAVQTQAVATFLGINFPFTKGPTSFPAPSYDNDLIQQAMIQIILTEKGERVMRPTFGSGVLKYVFENNDDLLEALIQTEVASALGRWEPRIILQNVQVTQNDTQVIVDIFYVVILTRQQQTLTVALPSP